MHFLTPPLYNQCDSPVQISKLLHYSYSPSRLRKFHSYKEIWKFHLIFIHDTEKAAKVSLVIIVGQVRGWPVQMCEIGEYRHKLAWGTWEAMKLVGDKRVPCPRLDFNGTRPFWAIQASIYFATWYFCTFHPPATLITLFASFQLSPVTFIKLFFYKFELYLNGLKTFVSPFCFSILLLKHGLGTIHIGQKYPILLLRGIWWAEV